MDHVEDELDIEPTSELGLAEVGIVNNGRLDPLTPQQFRDECCKIIQGITDLHKLEDEFNSLPPMARTLRYKDQYITKKTLNTFRNTIKEHVYSLAKAYHLGYRRKRKGNTKKARHLYYVILINDDGMKLLFENKDWPEAAELLEKMPLLKDKKILLNKTLMLLASLYTKKVKLHNEKNRARLSADSHMKLILNKYTDKLGTMDVNDFPYTRWSTIWSILRIHLTKEERDNYFKENKEVLDAEMSIVEKFMI